MAEHSHSHSGKQLAPDSGGSLSFSIVTPSFNQGRFLEQTICSVLDQRYGALEYYISDGGSSDHSIEIIRRHQDRLAGWSSARDAGQYDAINKAFAKTTGEVMGWLNSDDFYVPWTFSVVAQVMATHPQIEWLTSRIHLFADDSGKVIKAEEHPGFSRAQVLRGGTLPGCGWPAWAFIQQEATFWRRSLWDRTGGQLRLGEYPLAADFDLWMRFAAHAELYCVDVPLAVFRRHSNQKTSQHMAEYLRQATASFHANGGRPPGLLRSLCLKNSAKLLRFFQRRHARAVAQHGSNNHVRFAPEAGGETWRIGNG